MLSVPCVLLGVSRRGVNAAIVVAVLAVRICGAQTVAGTPPMGWNSWDAYGLTIDEKQFRANAQVLAGFRQYGWIYAVIDEGWFLKDPFATPNPQNYFHDASGRLTPDPLRYPSAGNGAGFRPLADWVHAQGLRFGIHILRGIPKGAVREDLPIANSAFHASDAADTNDTCPWNPDNYGVRNTPAGQAYYDSLMVLYAGWGVDFLKVDCIADHPYKPDEIRMIAEAIRKTGRPMVLSLSPGPAAVTHAGEIGSYAQMWRVADDIWDGWEFPGQAWPNGLLSAFDNLAKWSGYAKPGNWPDADMLPWGSLRPHPGWGAPRESHLTKDEQRTQFTLWAMARSPLILGANLTELDEFTRSLITEREVIGIDQNSIGSREVRGHWDDIRIWSALLDERRQYLAVFNMRAVPVTKEIRWAELSIKGPRHSAYEIWTRKNMGADEALHVELAPHGCALFRIE